MQTKIDALTNYPKPLKKNDMRSFLGLANYYRRFVPGYGDNQKAYSLQDRVDDSKVGLRVSLTEDTVLVIPDKKKPFLLYTDVSGVGIGAVLSQQGEDEMDWPVTYYSRKHKPTETRTQLPSKSAWQLWRQSGISEYISAGPSSPFNRSKQPLIPNANEGREWWSSKTVTGSAAILVDVRVSSTGDYKMPMLMECPGNPGHQTRPSLPRPSAREGEGRHVTGACDKTELRITVVACTHTY